MRSHRFEKTIAWSPCRSEDPRWMNPHRLAFVPALVSQLRVASELAADDSIGSPSEEKSRGSELGYCVALLTNRAHGTALVSAQVRRIGHSCCAHRAISIHRETRGGSPICYQHRSCRYRADVHGTLGPRSRSDFPRRRPHPTRSRAAIGAGGRPRREPG
jgi:hypothetical protein